MPTTSTGILAAADPALAAAVADGLAQVEQRLREVSRLRASYESLA